MIEIKDSMKSMAEKLISDGEGEVLKVYRDNLGFKTFGKGWCFQKRPLSIKEAQDLLDITSSDEAMATKLLNQDYLENWLTRLEPHDKMKASDYMFGVCVDESINNIKKTIPNFDEICPERQAVLVDMAYNMGINGLMGFPDMIKSIKNGDFERAAKDILYSDLNFTKYSDYYIQTGIRALRNSKIIASGKIN